MSSPDDSTITKNYSYRTNVRFTLEQYLRVQEDARVSGFSIPTLLRTVYFKKKPLKVIMDHDEQRRVLVALHRVGNNVNQIAKRVNMGFHEGWHKEFVEAVQTLSMLEKFLVGVYGVH